MVEIGLLQHLPMVKELIFAEIYPLTGTLD